jgi:hypothetical protein
MPRGILPYFDIFQTAYVTRDINAAIRIFADVYGGTDFKVFESTLNLSFPDVKTILKVGLFWAGDHEIELIQPIEDQTGVFAPALPQAPANLALHHYCMRVPGELGDWDAFRAKIPQERVVIAGSREGMRFIYTDERPTLGHFLEYFWANDEFLCANPHRIPPSQRSEFLAARTRARPI